MEPVNIRSYLLILIRRKWIVLITAVATIGAAALASFFMTPVYAATTTVRVATAVAGRVEYGDYIYSERLMNTYAEIITTDPILEQVQKQLNLDELPQIEVEVVPDTELIRITAEGPDAGIVRDVANLLADILQAESENFYSGGERSAQEIVGDLLAQAEEELTQARLERDARLLAVPVDDEEIDTLNRNIELKEQAFAFLLTQYESARLTQLMRASTISIVEPAVRPWAPAKPSLKINILLGSVVGFAAGLSLAFLIENMDTVFHSRSELEIAVKPPILGQIPALRKTNENGHGCIVTTNGSFSIEYESYRRLRTNILAINAEHPLKTLVATSAERGEGKSTIIANLAVTLAEAGHQILLIDADMRLPSLHKIFNLPNEIGLSDVLLDGIPLNEAVQHGQTAGLTILTSGPTPQKPAELLGSNQMGALIKQINEQFDVCLFDTPCLLSVTDAAVLSSRVDGVVLIVSLGLTRQETANVALQQLADVRANVIGLIVNRSKSERPYYSDKYYLKTVKES